MATRTTAKRKGRKGNGLFSYLGGDSYALKGSKKLLIPTKAELQQAARQAGREYGKRDKESGRGIKYSNMLVAFKHWIASMPQLPRGVSERDLKGKFTGGYHTADILRNPFANAGRYETVESRAADAAARRSRKFTRGGDQGPYDVIGSSGYNYDLGITSIATAKKVAHKWFNFSKSEYADTPEEYVDVYGSKGLVYRIDKIKNPFSIGETIAIGAGSAVGGAIGSAFVEPLIGKVKKAVNNPPRGAVVVKRSANNRTWVGVYYKPLGGVESTHSRKTLNGAVALAIKTWPNLPLYVDERKMVNVGGGRYEPQGIENLELVAEMKNPFKPKNRRGNPLDVDTSISISPKVLQMAESFHGREVETITDYEEIDNYESELADLGELRELEIVAKGRKSVIALTFDKDCPRLATRADGKQLYFVGGDQTLTEDVLEDLKRKGADQLSVHGGTLEKGDQRILPIGTVHTIAYFADKHHLEGTRKQRKGVEYEHTFGEENGVKPVLAYDVMNEGMILLGGDYRVEDVGIVN